MHYNKKEEKGIISEKLKKFKTNRRFRYFLPIAAFNTVLVAAAIMAGYFLATFQLGQSDPETVVPSTEFCGEQPDALCGLKYDNYRRAWQIGKRLAERKCLVAVAESFTSGNLAGTFGKVRWAGLVLAGGITSYNTSVKNALLGVPETTDKGVISEATARDMVNGLRELLRPANDWQKRRGKERRVCLYIAITGAAIRWGEIEPRAHIGLAAYDESADVYTFALREGLTPRNYARRYNIQLAIRHGLTLIARRLEMPL